MCELSRQWTSFHNLRKRSYMNIMLSVLVSLLNCLEYPYSSISSLSLHSQYIYHWLFFKDCILSYRYTSFESSDIHYLSCIFSPLCDAWNPGLKTCVEWLQNEWTNKVRLSLWLDTISLTSSEISLSSFTLSLCVKNNVHTFRSSKSPTVEAVRHPCAFVFQQFKYPLQAQSHNCSSEYSSFGGVFCCSAMLFLDSATLPNPVGFFVPSYYILDHCDLVPMSVYVKCVFSIVANNF